MPNPIEIIHHPWRSYRRTHGLKKLVTNCFIVLFVLYASVAVWLQATSQSFNSRIPNTAALTTQTQPQAANQPATAPAVTPATSPTTNTSTPAAPTPSCSRQVIPYGTTTQSVAYDSPLIGTSTIGINGWKDVCTNPNGSTYLENAYLPVDKIYYISDGIDPNL